ncbi:MAG: C4-type zinc ribbon domain-containing protein [Spirochaetales bacterium]|uniref:C4-type zinc ribbon domain-containing protein n=1 Tax=Candidatus Thalassospirochaeta sargassi TaxID=3119039 RepID=A0AAJ1MMZ5_9SPIO|nr:C4-type zinc ribbon domain-containing protein [Spirochaetales bacterium]
MKHDIFEKLKELQDILSKKYEIERDINEIPKAMVTKTELLNRLKKTYIEKNEKVEGTKKRIANLRTRLAEAEAQREQYEKQMDEIKTQREYEVLDKEIKDATEREQDCRKDIIKSEKDLEEFKYMLERDEQLINQQEEELAAEEEKNKNESESKRQLLEELEEQEKQTTPDMDSEILFKFERIIKSKSGVGIVPVKNAVCSGCHMILPAQFVNEVRKGEEIHFCPYCSRILFFEEIESDDNYDMTFLSDDEAEGLADLEDDDDDF